MSWNRATLGRLCGTITKGTTPTSLGHSYAEAGVPFLRAQNLLGGSIALNGDTLFISESVHDALGRSKIAAGDVLLSIAGTVGRAAVVPPGLGDLNCNQAVAILRPLEGLDPDYLKDWLQTKGAQNQIRGAKVTATISNLSLGQIKRLEIPLPPLDEQRRIAAILDKADTIRRRRQEAIDLSDELLRSTFLQMFGDSPEWPRARIDDLCAVKGGKRLPQGEPYADGVTKHPYIRVVDFWRMSVRLDELKYLRPETQGKISRYTISTADVYISIAGSIGLAGTIPPELDGANLTENAAKLVIKDRRITNRYLAWFLNSPDGKRQIERATKATSQPKLALFRIGEIELPVPSLAAQQQFDKIANGVRTLQASCDRACLVADDLHQSLVQRAFRGEL